jgi:hypothetical protein
MNHRIRTRFKIKDLSRVREIQSEDFDFWTRVSAFVSGHNPNALNARIRKQQLQEVLAKKSGGSR